MAVDDDKIQKAPDCFTKNSDLSAMLPSGVLPQARFDAQRQGVAANAAWLTIFKVEPRGLAWLDWVHPDDFARELAALVRMDAGTIDAYRLPLRLRLGVTADANIWHVSEVLIVAERDGGGELLGITVTLLPPSLGASGADDAACGLNNADAWPVERQQLAAALSHDVRQHARLAGAFLSLVERGPLEPQQRNRLRTASAHTERLNQTLSGLVRWLRLADATVERRACALSACWAQAIAAVPGLDPERIVSSALLPSIDADPLLMTELFTALLDNVARYGDGRAVLSVSPESLNGQAGVNGEGRAWVLTLDDHGAGIPEVAQVRALEPLQRLHTWEQMPGLGLGLAIAARIAARHGGGLSLHPAPTGGCRVRIRLPA